MRHREPPKPPPIDTSPLPEAYLLRKITSFVESTIPQASSIKLQDFEADLSNLLASPI